MSTPLRIGQLAAAVGVKTDSIRFYERAGLLPSRGRGANGYRTYDDAALKRLRFIKKAQSLGFTLDEIKRIFQLRAEGQAGVRTRDLNCGGHAGGDGAKAEGDAHVCSVAAQRTQQVERCEAIQPSRGRFCKLSESS